MKKLTVALGMSGILVFGGAASCKQDREPREWYNIEYPDCDRDDRSPHWEAKDCGPSPRPMRTAYQPAPSKKPSTAPAPKKTRR